MPIILFEVYLCSSALTSIGNLFEMISVKDYWIFIIFGLTFTNFPLLFFSIKKLYFFIFFSFLPFLDGIKSSITTLMVAGQSFDKISFQKDCTENLKYENLENLENLKRAIFRMQGNLLSHLIHSSPSRT